MSDDLVEQLRRDAALYRRIGEDARADRFYATAVCLGQLMASIRSADALAIGPNGRGGTKITLDFEMPEPAHKAFSVISDPYNATALERLPTPDTREWYSHLDYAGEPMKPGQFRDPPERLPTATEERVTIVGGKRVPADIAARQLMGLYYEIAGMPDMAADVRSENWQDGSGFGPGSERYLLSVMATLVETVRQEEHAFARHQSPTAPIEGVRDELVSALFPTPEADASYNLQGALDDLRGRFRPDDGDVIASTIARVIDQLERARSALSRAGEKG